MTNTEITWYDVSIVRNGRSYDGAYHVEGEVVTVRYEGKSTSTQLGGLTVDVLAPQLLAELVLKACAAG